MQHTLVRVGTRSPVTLIASITCAQIRPERVFACSSTGACGVAETLVDIVAVGTVSRKPGITSIYMNR